MPAPGLYLWCSPAGRIYLVDHTGTSPPQTPRPPALAVRVLQLPERHLSCRQLVAGKCDQLAEPLSTEPVADVLNGLDDHRVGLLLMAHPAILARLSADPSPAPATQGTAVVRRRRVEINNRIHESAQ